MKKYSAIFSVLLSVILFIQVLVPAVSFAAPTVPNDDASQVEVKKTTINNEITTVEFQPILTSIGKPAIRVPVLMFHDLSTGPSKGSTLNVDEFQVVINYLSDHHYNTVTLTELYDYLTIKDATLPENPIILTFDDGYYSNYQYAYPILKKMNMKAVFSVIGWSIGKEECLKDILRKTNKQQSKIVKHFNEAAMKEMARSGLIEIENHTFDLHSEAGISSGYHEPTGKGVGKIKGESFTNYKMRLSRDLVYMNEIVKDIIGYKPQFITYPYGNYDQDSEKVIKELGFKGSLTIQHGIRFYKSAEDLYEIPRIEIKSVEDLKYLKGE